MKIFLFLILIFFIIYKTFGFQINNTSFLAQRKTSPYLLAFYYAWYRTPHGPMGNGKWIHWYSYGYYMGKNHPMRGLYDSWDEKVIREHILEAIEAGIYGFVVSW